VTAPLPAPAGGEAAPRRVALVTGASRGIGRAIAARLAADGALVIGSATTAAGAAAIGEMVGEVSGAAGAPGGRGIVLDVTDAAALDAAIDDVVRAEGRLDVLVNNAGITRDTLALRMKDADWDAVLDTNLKAVFRACRAAIRPMMKQRHGRIVNITSVVGALGNAGQANYAAAKAGVAALSRSLAREVASRGITVNCVAPGFVATDMTSVLPEAQRGALLAQIPVGRLGTAEEIAHAVAFLASDGAAYVTGTELHVNGGMWM
jgi:3-oxoacyl-[acyl-carrier protein] reductase